MFLTLVKCNICPDKEFQYDYKIRDKYSYSYALKCIHFDVPISFYFKKEKFERYVIGFKCNNCQNEKKFKFIDESKKDTYCCEKCKCGSIFYMYEISDNKEINIMNEISDNNKDKNIQYKTPNKDPNKEKLENVEKININFFYDNKKYNHVVDANKNIDYYYNEIRDKIKFPDGKKFYKNYIELDHSKTFKENKVNNGMKLEIGN